MSSMAVAVPRSSQDPIASCVLASRPTPLMHGEGVVRASPLCPGCSSCEHHLSRRHLAITTALVNTQHTAATRRAPAWDDGDDTTQTAVRVSRRSHRAGRGGAPYLIVSKMTLSRQLPRFAPPYLRIALQGPRLQIAMRERHRLPAADL